MNRNRISTEKLCLSALLLAWDVVFTRLLALNTPVMKIGLGFAAVAVCAMLYGPWWAGALAAAADVIGSLAFPTGAYYPGFTVTAALTGIIFGLCLYRKTPGWKSAVPAAALNCVLVSFLANSAMIARISGADYGALLAARAVQLAVLLPLQALVIRALGKLPEIIENSRKNTENKRKNT